MKKLKLTLEGIGSMLNKEQMKSIVGGDYGGGHICYGRNITCYYEEAGRGWTGGWCDTNSNGRCVCDAGSSSVLFQSCVYQQ